MSSWRMKLYLSVLVFIEVSTTVKLLVYKESLASVVPAFSSERAPDTADFIYLLCTFNAILGGTRLVSLLYPQNKQLWLSLALIHAIEAVYFVHLHLTQHVDMDIKYAIFIVGVLAHPFLFGYCWASTSDAPVTGKKAL